MIGTSSVEGRQVDGFDRILGIETVNMMVIIWKRPTNHNLATRDRSLRQQQLQVKMRGIL